MGMVGAHLARRAAFLCVHKNFTWMKLSMKNLHGWVMYILLIDKGQAKARGFKVRCKLVVRSEKVDCLLFVKHRR